MDRLLVRVLPIILNLYVIVAISMAWFGYDISIYDYWFSCPITMGVLLSVLVNVQGKYHCKWMRYLCYNLVFVPSVTYLDSAYLLFDDAYVYLIVITSSMALAILATIVLSIRHFHLVRKVLNGKNSRYEELKPLKCGCSRKDC